MKSTLSLIWACARCILYPETKIVLVAPVKNQSRNFIKKAKELCRNSPNLLKEIDGGMEAIKTGLNESIIPFKNGSWIEVQTYSENARSARANILLVDEYAMLKDDKILISVFSPMLSEPRSPLYSELSLKERKKYYEPTRQVFLSSIRTDAEWSWDKLVKYVDYMAEGDPNYGVLCLPYQLGVKGGYIDEMRVRQTFKENESLIDVLRSEYEAIPISGGSDSFFKYSDLSAMQDHCNVLIAKTDDEFIKYKDKPEKWKFYKPKIQGEIRIISMDVALIESPKNDNTAIWITSLIPNGDKYHKSVIYGETMHGLNALVQSLRLKQLFYEMECDFVAIDSQGNGQSIVDTCMKETYDNKRGITYPAWTTANPEDTKTGNRVLSPNAIPVMYAVKTSSADKHRIFVIARDMIATKELHLPTEEQEAIDYYNEHFNYYKIQDAGLRSRILNTYVQVKMLIYEAINLETVISNGYYNLKEKPSRMKDRVMSLCYNLDIVKEKEDEYIALQNEEQSSFLDFVQII